MGATTDLPGYIGWRDTAVKLMGLFCFACSQVWSEHRMQTTSWDPCRAASLRERTSQHPPVTSRTSSTRVRGTPGQSSEVMSPRCVRRDPPIQPITNHTDTLSPRGQQTHSRTPPTTQLMKIDTGTSNNSKVTSMVISAATITTAVVGTTWSIMATTATAIAMRMTTDMGRSRGNTSVGDGRNVCKGNFSF